MKRTLWLLVAGLSLGACGTEASNPLASPDVQHEDALGGGLASADVDYLQQAASYAVLQDELSKLARVRSPSPMVRDYADGLVTYAQNQQKTIAALANSRGHIIASSLSVRDRFHIKKLSIISGPYFDFKFMGYQLSEVDAAQLTAAYASRATRDPEVRALAADATRTLARWLQLARYVDTYRGTSADVPGALGPLPGANKAGDPDQGKGPVTEPGQGQDPDQGRGPVTEPGQGQYPDQGRGPVTEPGQGQYPDQGKGPEAEPGQGQYPDHGKDL